MSSPDSPCQDLCTSLASRVTTPIEATGVCDYAVSAPLTQVTVSDCRVDSVSSLIISDTTALITVQTVVSFTFLINDTRQAAECRTAVDLLISPVEAPVTLSSSPPCMAEVTCRATYAGYDPLVEAEEFLVTVIGTVSCYGCESTVVTVPLCPPTA